MGLTFGRKLVLCVLNFEHPLPTLSFVYVMSFAYFLFEGDELVLVAFSVAMLVVSDYLYC